MKDMGKNFVNPFFAYAFAYSVVLIIYIMPFSDLYPNIEFKFFLFMLFSIVFAMYLKKYLIINIFKQKKEQCSYRPFILWFILLGFLYILDFIYMGAIPLLSPDPEGGYRAFEGIPFFHVLIITGNAFYSNVLFEQFLINKKKFFLFLWFLSFIPYMLIYTRGSIIIGLLTAMLIYFSYKRIKKKHLFKLGVISIIVLYLFGVAGNIRLNQALYNESVNDSSTILNFGLATKEFEESIIPNEFFWGYIYISSPMANLQNIMMQSENKNIDFKDIVLVISTEWIPDSISKRLLDFIGIDLEQLPMPPLLTSAFNVSTFFARAGDQLGFLGLFIMYIYYIIFTIFYCVILMKNNKYKVIGIATFSTLVYMSTFNNVFVYSGWAFQLIYPLIFGYRRNKI